MSNNNMNNQTNGLEVAIIGMSGRFPGARNLKEFWENIKNGICSIEKVTGEDYENAKQKFEAIRQSNWINVSASIADMEYFDSSFFGYTPKEAELMNPQMRIFHECAWEALEDSGYEPRSYRKAIGLYAGATTSVQWEVGVEISGLSRDIGSLGTQQLADKDYLATRIAYNFNLRGPVAIVQTACSTSLVAVHMACQALLNGECHMALAGGISAFLGLKSGYVYTDGSILSKDGAVRAFDAKASGTVFGNGTGVLALKALEDAIADRDHIYAVIKASAMNNDGSDKAAFPAPSVEGQTRVIRMAQQLSEVEPESITYVEAHGTGTNIGDPIEIEALTKAFNTDKRQYCAIGAVKSNVGHLDAAAGVTGLIKTALALKHRQIPPSINFETPNPKIDFENSPFFVNTELREWKNDQYPLRAGVSAFGVGGTNAHLILEEAPHSLPSSESRKWQLITISAKNRKSLDRNTEKLVQYFQEHPELNLADATYTLKVGRRVLEHRRMTVSSSIDEAVEAFTTPGSEKVKTYVAKEKYRPAIFMFSGQGSQYVNMGLDLYRTEETFREEMDRCFEILRPLMGFDIKEILYPNSADTTGHAKQLPDINQTEITQPVIFIIEYVLARLIMKWGIKPYAMIGHSIGEYVAAALSGVFSLEDALKLVCLRGRLMQKMASGSMLSIPLPEEQVMAILKDHSQLELAAVNSSTFCVVAGPHEAVDGLVAQLKEKGTDCTRLHTSHAFHSRMMEPMLEEFLRQVEQIKLNKPELPYISNVTGTWISIEDALDPAYWVKQIRGTVRFSDGLSELFKEAYGVFIEVGPGKALATFVRQHEKRVPSQLIINMVKHPKDDISDDKFLHEKIGELWLYCQPVDWNEYYSNEKRNRVSLPTYAFDDQYFWFKDEPFLYMGTEMRRYSKGFPVGPQMPVLDGGKKEDLSDWFYLPTWKIMGITAAQKARSVEKHDRVLVFLGSDNLSLQVVKQLEQKGNPVTTVTIGSQFAVTGDNGFEIDPRNRGNYLALFTELKKQSKTPGIIIHLWNLSGNTDNNREVLDLHEVEKSQDLGFYSLFYLAQAIGEQGITDSIRVSILSTNMQEVSGGELLRPGQATLLGPVRVIPLEYPNIKCKSIDIVPPQQGSEQEKFLIPHLIEDFLLQNDDVVVAYRGTQRWVQIFEPLRLEKSSSKLSPRLRQGGVYLITGGLGGLGLVIARDLAQSLHPKLILTGRSNFPGKDQWSLWIEEHGETDTTSLKIRDLQRLEEMGAEVMPVRAEVSNLEQMKTVVQQAEEKFGPINGVIHAAGIPDGGMLQLRKREDLEPILLPKVAGTLVLHQIFEGKELDMLILFSSIIAVAPPLGQIGYSGANAFLDAFAHLRTAKGNYTVSINWDGWQEVGMVVNMMKKMATGGIASAQAIPDFPKKDAPHPFFEYRMEKDSDQAIFVSSFRADKYWALDEHRILVGKPSLPGTGFLETINAAFGIHTTAKQTAIRDLGFIRPLMLEEKGEREVQTLLKRKDAGNEFEFIIRSRAKGVQTDWENHATGIVMSTDMTEPAKHNIEEIREKFREKEMIDVTQIKEVFNSPELFGPRWRCCKWIMRGNDQWLARLELPEDFTADIASYPLHPALLDVAVGFPAFIPEVFKGETYLPFSYKQLKISKPLTSKIYSFARYSKHQPSPEDSREVLVFDVTIMDEEGVELIDIEGYTFKKVVVPARQVSVPTPQDIIQEKAVEPTEPQQKIIPKSEAESFSVFIRKVGDLESISFMPFSRRAPRSEYGEIEIEVSHVGVNFKDVLFTLGILPLPSARYIKLGFECAGKIVRIAEGVEDYKVGDEVVALVAPCFMEHVTLPRDFVMKIPKGLTAADAVTLPMAYITSYYCLIKKADLQPGERVLIHSAAGGVGMAAVKIAQWKGAEIFATAGTPEKREYLKSLGIQHVFDSRSLDFADKVMEATNGEGVDIVLNSLAGEFIPKSISLLRKYGRFLELGVKDFYADTKLGMKPFMNSLSYFAITMTTEIPNIFSVWKEIVDHVNKKHFPPLPYRIFTIDRISDAFKYMFQGIHTGRVLLSFENKNELVLQMPPDEEDGKMDFESTPLYALDIVHSPHTVGRSVVGEKSTTTAPGKGPKPQPSSTPAVPTAVASTPAPASTPRFSIENGILPSQGVDAFNRILHEALPQLIVSTRDFRIPASQLNSLSGSSRDMGGQMPFSEATESAAPKARPEMLTDYVAPRDEIERQLVDIFKSLLGFEAGIMDDFFEMGGDSLKASGVINKANHIFGITIPVSEMFVRKNIKGLSDYIRGAKNEDTKLEQILNEIEAMPGEKS